MAVGKRKAKVWYQYGDQNNPNNKVADVAEGLRRVHREAWWLALNSNMPLTRSHRSRSQR